MPGTTPSNAALAVATKYKEIAGKHNDNIPQVEEIHNSAVQEVLPVVLQEVGLSDDTQTTKWAQTFLEDRCKFWL
jgi:hypothetical protein